MGEEEVFTKPEYINMIFSDTSQHEMASEAVGEYWQWRGFP